MTKTFFLAVFWLVSWSVWGQKPVVRFLHLNDVYEISPLENGQAGGMARVAGLRQDLISQGVPVVTFLVGDFVSPSVIGTLRVDGERVQGKHMVEVMNQLGIDWVTFGNHEFDIPMSALQKRIDESSFRWMSTNVSEVTAQETRSFQQRGQPIPKTWIYALDSLKIGFFAVTLASNQKPWVQYDDVEASIRRILPTLQASCDVLVGLTHLNVADDRQLVAKFPEVSLWMGGHDHEHIKEIIGTSTLAKADANAKTVWVHELRQNSENSRLTWHSELNFIKPTTPTDSATQSLVDRWEGRAEASLAQSGITAKEVIFTTQVPLDGRESSVRQFSTGLTDLILNAMATGYEKSDFALLNGGSIRVDDQLVGAITQWDIVRILPFGGSIVQVHMTGKLLKQILATGQKNKGNGGYLHIKSIQKRVEPTRIKTRKSYRVILPSFLLTGQETNMAYLTEQNTEILSIQKPWVGSDNEDIRKILIRYLKASEKKVH